MKERNKLTVGFRRPEAWFRVGWETTHSCGPGRLQTVATHTGSPLHTKQPFSESKCSLNGLKWINRWCGSGDLCIGSLSCVAIDIHISPFFTVHTMDKISNSNRLHSVQKTAELEKLNIAQLMVCIFKIMPHFIHYSTGKWSSTKPK